MLKVVLSAIEREDAKENLWIVGAEVGRFLHYLVRVWRPNSIVEIGTSVGYSALWMASALSESGHLWTIESHKERFERAKTNINKAKMNNKITQILHHAPEVFYDKEVNLPKTVDLVFFDATKKQHYQFYEAVKPSMQKGGLIIVDNVDSHSTAFAGFIDFMIENPRLNTVKINIGTGLLLATINS